MSYKALLVSIALAVAWTAAIILAMRPSSAPLRHFVAQQGSDQYRVQAHEARTEGFCTVFIRDGVRISGVCGYHTWSEAVEVE